ncbi:glycosyltransferase family 9 protein [Mucilaginibacter psychrotolerans]|uniref:glycosyltransferase family 9 protein n=1 Tax=Mucilaginibacter psychrotolerans TaxID=1524096 RepID=UPI0013052995|nr:glycosyltransferase family 9 protein [Mucilaginibacter psychrotolerans]
MAVIPYDTLLSTTLLNLIGAKIIPLKYTYYDPVTDQNKIPEKHIVLKMADMIGLNGAIENKPDFYLTAEESKKGMISKKQIAIAVSNTSAKTPVKNKEWIDERYQEIVDRFRAEYDFVQIGAHNDYPLNNVTDLRGKTTLRESAAILKNSVLLIAYAGFTMHLARAVDCRSVIVYGGRETPAQTGYNSFCNIYSAVHCSPCWLNNLCGYGRMCMTQISTDMAISEILKELENSSKPVPVDILYN